MSSPEEAGGPAEGHLNKALVTWKEIAAHMGCAVRTVQRWEREADLPVHRLMTGKRRTPYAYPSELDAWPTPSSAAPRHPMRLPTPGLRSWLTM